MPPARHIKKSVVKARTQSKQIKKIVKMHSPRVVPVKKVIAMVKNPAPIPEIKPTKPEPKKIVAAVIKKAPSVVKPIVKAVVAKRTIHYGSRFGSWRLEKSWDAAHRGQCRLKIGTKQVIRNSVGIQYWVSLRPSELKIYTTSQVNASIANTGIKINKGRLIPFTRVDNATNPVLEKNITSLLKRGKTLNIYLGFSYITPKSAPQHIRINLKELDKGIPALKACSL